MKLDFENPIVPNFVRTKQGNFSLAQLSEDDLKKYTSLWVFRLMDRRKEQLEKIKSPPVKHFLVTQKKEENSEK